MTSAYCRRSPPRAAAGRAAAVCVRRLPPPRTSCSSKVRVRGPNRDRPLSLHVPVTECARALEQAHAPFAAFAAACASAIAAPAPAALTAAKFAAESVSSPSRGLQPPLSGTRSRPAATLRGVAHGGGGGGCVGGDNAVNSAAGALRARGWGARRVLSGCLARPTERDSVALIMHVLVAVHALSAHHRRPRRAR